MRIIILSIALLFCAFSAQSQVLKSAGVWYFLDVDSMTARPAVLPNGTELAYVIGTRTLYKWNRGSSAWEVNSSGGLTMPFDSIYFTPSNVAPDTAELKYSSDYETFVFGADGTTIEIGQKEAWYVKNQTGSTINKGTVVRASGTLGSSGRILISPMVIDGTVSSKYLLGITASNISNGSDGYVIDFGKLRKFNTSAWSDGAVLYAGAGGTLTATEPNPPSLRLPIAFVVHSHATNGVLAIRIQTGNELHELHDVDTTGINTGEGLVYNSTLHKWQASAGKLIAAVDTASLLATKYWTNSNFFPIQGGTLTGTGGAGFIGLPSQVTAPGTPASGLNIYAQGSSFNWKGTDGFERLFASTLTGGRTYTLPDVSGTFAFGTGTADRSARWSATNTLAAGNMTDNGTKLQALLPFQLNQWTTAGRPTGVTGYEGYNTTGNGKEWYQGSRWAYVLESTFARGTSTYIPFFDANRQLTESINLIYNGTALRVGTPVGSGFYRGTDVFAATGGVTLGNPGTSSQIPLRIKRSDSGGADASILFEDSQFRGLFEIRNSSTAANTETAFYSYFNYARSGAIKFKAIDASNSSMEFGEFNGSANAKILLHGSAGFPGSASPVIQLYNVQTPVNSGNQIDFYGWRSAPANTATVYASIGGRKTINSSSISGELFFSTANLITTGSPTTRMIINSQGLVDMQNSARIRDSLRLEDYASSILSTDASGYVKSTTIGSGVTFSSNTISAQNIYNASGTLSANRVLRGADQRLSFYRTKFTPLIDSTKEVIALVSRTDTTLRRNGLFSNWGARGASTIIGGNFGADTATTFKGNVDGSVFIGTNLGYIEGGLNSYWDVVIGHETKAKSNQPKRVAIGAFSLVTSNDATAIGYNAKAHTRSTSIGSESSALGIRSGSFGSAALSNVDSSYAFGVGEITSKKRQFLYGILNGNTIGTQAHHIMHGKFSVGLDSSFSYNPVTDILRLANYGTPATTAAVLSKTLTNYGVGFATDGTVTSREIKRDTTIYVTDADYNFASAITSTQVLARHNRIIIYSKLSSGATSDNQIILHSASADFLQCEIIIYSNDASADADATSIDFTTNGAVDGAGGTTSTYGLSQGQRVNIRAVNDGGYKWFFN